MPSWIRAGELAISTRPGYRTGPEFSVPREAVEAWVREMKEAGIASIICLLDEDQLPLYRRSLAEGLLEHYRRQGFQTEHIPTADGQAEPFTAAQLERAWQAYQRLAKPVLVHCSAGHDRTGRVIRYVLERLQERSEPCPSKAR